MVAAALAAVGSGWDGLGSWSNCAITTASIVAISSRKVCATAVQNGQLRAYQAGTSMPASKNSHDSGYPLLVHARQPLVRRAISCR